jgi:PST family polysaccharide transporter
VKKTFKDILISLLIYCASFFVTFFTNYYVARKIGPLRYGDIIYAQNFVLYFSVIIAYGFDINSTRKISQNIGNKIIIEEVISKTIGSRLLLFLFCSVGFIIFVLQTSQESEMQWLYLFTFTGVLGFALFPMWYFQGIQKNYLVSLCVLIPKILTLIAVLVFVVEEKHYLRVNLISGVSFSAIGILALFYVLKRNKFHFHFYSIKSIYLNLKESFYLFISTFVDTLFYTSSIVIVRFFCYAELGYFSAVHKLIEIAKGIILVPIGQVFFPLITIIAAQANYRFEGFLIKLFSLMAIFGALGTLFIYIFSPVIVSLAYGEEFLQSVDYLKKISPLILFMCISNIVSRQALLGLGKDKERLIILTISGIVSYSWLYFVELSVKNIITSLMFVEIISIFLSIIYLRTLGYDLLRMGAYKDIVTDFFNKYGRK